MIEQIISYLCKDTNKILDIQQTIQNIYFKLHHFNIQIIHLLQPVFAMTAGFLKEKNHFRNCFLTHKIKT
jgi:hypothetical protein